LDLYGVDICYMYILFLVKDSKCGYPAACNAAETILIHRHLLSRANFFAKLCEMLKSNNVRVRFWFFDGSLFAWDLNFLCCCSLQVEIFAGPNLSRELTFGPPPTKSLRIEYGRLACTVEVVNDLNAAINHINTYGSSHTDTIVTENG